MDHDPRESTRKPETVEEVTTVSGSSVGWRVVTIAAQAGA
jgi:hypothetical protein